MRFSVGRIVNGKLEPAFTIERQSDGGVRFTHMHGLTDAEHHRILAHFGRVVHGKVVVQGEQHIRMFKPGTARHFEQASYQVPAPYNLMPRNE